MHELTLAVSIVDLALAEAKKNNAESITGIDLEVGELSGVDREALEFALKFATEDTPAQSAQIRIVQTRGEGWCASCQTKFIMKEIWTPCPDCDSPATEIIHGKELRVISVEIDDS